MTEQKKVNGWNEHRNLVLNELERLGKEAGEQNNELKGLIEKVERRVMYSFRELSALQRAAEKDLVGLRLKVALWGSCSGLAASSVLLIVKGLVK